MASNRGNQGMFREPGQLGQPGRFWQPGQLGQPGRFWQPGQLATRAVLATRAAPGNQGGSGNQGSSGNQGGSGNQGSSGTVVVRPAIAASRAWTTSSSVRPLARAARPALASSRETPRASSMVRVAPAARAIKARVATRAPGPQASRVARAKRARAIVKLWQSRRLQQVVSPQEGRSVGAPLFCPRTIECGAIPSELQAIHPVGVRQDPPASPLPPGLPLPLAPPRYSVALPRRSPPVPSHRTRAKETPYPPLIEVDLVPRRSSTCYGPAARLDDLGPRLAHA